MAWDFFLETVRGRKFKSQIFGTECRNFRDCFLTVRAKFLGLFSDRPDKILGLNIGNF